MRDVLQESLSRLEIGVRAELPDQLTAVQCGQSDLERLLFNLMSNGRDALPNGGTLTVTARMADSYVEITVSDDGIGMTSGDAGPDRVAVLHDEGTRDRPRSLDVPVDCRRGRRHPHDREPRRRGHARHRAPVGGPGRCRERLMARPKILVVDDEPGMLRTIERILSNRYDVRAVRLPSAALDAAARAASTWPFSTCACRRWTGSRSWPGSGSGSPIST